LRGWSKDRPLFLFWLGASAVCEGCSAALTSIGETRRPLGNANYIRNKWLLAAFALHALPGVNLIMKRPAFFFALPLLATFSACASTDGSMSTGTGAAPMAKAALLAADGSRRGDASVTETATGLRVAVRAIGLTPGVHAVHIHMNGTCNPPDFASAGGHWNPTGRQHGKDNPAGMHMGDMPNLTAGPDGSGQIEYLIPGGTLRTGSTPLLDADGAAVVIHAQPDDNRTDPAGNAGGRIACGILSEG
jgi:Cu-Zn family superoxide dismutase